MKKILFLITQLTVAYTFGQNTWNSSTISTITTGGKVAIGTATPQPGFSLTNKNTDNTQLSGFYNNINNTAGVNTEQYGIHSNILFNSTSGIKVGFMQQFNSAATTDNYGMFLNGAGSSVGNRMGLVSWMSAGSKVECGIYSIVNNPSINLPYFPSADRAGYFIGALETVARSNSEKVLIVNRRDLSAVGFGTDVFRVYGDGKVFATEVNVKLASAFPDYVFNNDYYLMPWKELNNYITDHGHLPNLPTAETVEQEGINIGEMTKTLVEKIEELTLYMLKQQQEIELLKLEINTLRAE